MKRQNWRSIGSVLQDVMQRVEIDRQQRAPEGEALKLLPPPQRPGSAVADGNENAGRQGEPPREFAGREGYPGGQERDATGTKRSGHPVPEPSPRKRPVVFTVAMNTGLPTANRRPHARKPPRAVGRPVFIVIDGGLHASTRSGVVVS